MGPIHTSKMCSFRSLLQDSWGGLKSTQHSCFFQSFKKKTTTWNSSLRVKDIFIATEQIEIFHSTSVTVVLERNSKVCSFIQKQMPLYLNWTQDQRQFYHKPNWVTATESHILQPHCSPWSCPLGWSLGPRQCKSFLCSGFQPYLQF